MSAAYWRRAMNSGLVKTSDASGLPKPVGASASKSSGTIRQKDRTDNGSSRFKSLFSYIRIRHILVLAALVLYPFLVSPFFTFQIGGQSLAFGLLALSLTLLAGYGGMVSLAQMTVGGVAAYALCIFGTSATPTSLGWPWWLVIPIAIVIAVLFSIIVGYLSVRTEGIYTIMITLAMGVAFYYLALQNYSVFNGFQGFQRVYPPEVFGIDWRKPTPFYFMCLSVSLLAYLAVKWLVRTPFGLALQGIRDNPRRMNSLGYNVVAHRVAAYAVAGVIAALGGILLVWYNGLITPNSINTGWLINVLVMAILGGLKHPIGAFIGSLVFVLLQTFAIDVVDRERFNLVIGIVFLLIVLFSPDGLIGLWTKLRARFGAKKSVTSANKRRQA